MSKASELKKEFCPENLYNNSKDCHREAGLALSRALCNIPNQYTKFPVKIKIRRVFEDILNVYSGVFFDEIYNSLNPQNKVLVNGIFFKEFFHEYAASLNMNLNDKKIQPTIYQLSHPLAVRDETELKKLLGNVWEQIPVIYITKKENKEPAFVSNSLWARFVSDTQIDAVRKLHDMFNQVVNMTTFAKSK